MPCARWIGLVVACLVVSSAHGQTRTEIYNLQERCGMRAAELFDKDFPKSDRKGLELFENHYNVHLNRCFILEESTIITNDQGKTNKTKLLTLIDVNDNKVQGSFSSLNCDVQERKCDSEDEFRSLIKLFMQD